MTTENLGNAQILPAARPVSTFIRPMLRQQTAGAAQPVNITGVTSNFGLVRQQSGGNVQGNYGSNNISNQVLAQGSARTSRLNQLARALEPFGANLVNTIGKGLEVYASGEYQAGQNEAMRAYANAQSQVNQGEQVYAAQNRELARQSPMAAMSMDLVNPYRAAGRERQLSQLAGAEVGQAMKAAFRERSADLAQLEPNDPRINELKAGVVSGIADRFGLDEKSQGFAEFVLPKVNEAWDWVSEEQFRHRQGYLKQTQTGLVTNFILSAAPQMLADGIAPSEVTGWINDQITDQARRRGMPGEPAELRQQVLKELYQVALVSGRADLAGAVAPLLDAAGISPMDVIGMEDRLDEREFRQMERLRTMQEQSFRDELAGMAGELGDPNQLAAAAQQLLEDPRFEGMSPAIATKILSETIGLGDELAMQLGAGEGIDQLMAQLEGLPPSQFNQEKVAILELVEQQIQGLPAEERRRARQRMAELSRQKEGQAVSLNPVAEQEIENVVKSRLAAAYPELAAAGLAGASNEQIMAILTQGGPNATLAYEKLRRALLVRSEAAIAEREAQKGGRLTPGEVSQVIADVSSKLTPQNFPDLYPGAVTMQQSQSSQAPAAGGGTQAQGPTEPTPTPGYGVGHLDQMPDRATRLKNWQTQPVLTLPSATQAVQQAAGGGRAAFSPALVRAAKEAGTDPGTFLIRQLELHRTPDGRPAITIPPEMRNQIIKQGKDMAAQDGYGQTVMDRVGGAMGQFGGWLMNTVTGARPGSSATLEPMALRPRPQAIPVTPAPRIAAAPSRPTTQPRPQGPAPVQVSHPETGRGFTMPGMRDANGRPLVLAQPAMASFAQMVMDSGGVVNPRDITSAQRSPEKNRAVGGVEGSSHLKGGAIDIHGRSKEWIRANGARYGWKWLDYDGHDGHFDFVGGGGQPVAGGSQPRLAMLSGGGGIFRGDPSGPAGAALMQKLGGGGSVGAGPTRLALPAPRQSQDMTIANLGAPQLSNVDRFMKGLSFLESDFGKNRGNGGGPFQFLPATAKWAADAAGLDPDKLMRGVPSEVARFIQWRHPDGWEAILRGDMERAAQIINPTWVSLPGGSQAHQNPSRYARWRQIVGITR